MLTTFLSTGVSASIDQKTIGIRLLAVDEQGVQTGNVNLLFHARAQGLQHADQYHLLNVTDEETAGQAPMYKLLALFEHALVDTLHHQWRSADST